MVFSKIAYNCTAYYSLHAEQSLNNLRIDSVMKMPAVYQTQLDEICDDIRKDQQNSMFVLNCDNIDNVQINVVEKRLAALVGDEKKTVIFENIKESLLEQLSFYPLFRTDNVKYRVEEDMKYEFFPLKNRFDCSQLICTDKVFDKVFLENVAKYNKSQPGGKLEHTSSSVSLSTYIDIKRFIIEKRSFMLYSIYRLALKIQAHWLKNDAIHKKKPILVCQSLNGSYIASVLASLLDLDLYMLDQVGPINKLYRAIGAKIKADADYLVVSDMVCVGTEVKIVKNIIEYLGGNYIGNVALVRAFLKQFSNTEEVLLIDKNNCKQLDYQIIVSIN